MLIQALLTLGISSAQVIVRTVESILKMTPIKALAICTIAAATCQIQAQIFIDNLPNPVSGPLTVGFNQTVAAQSFTTGATVETVDNVRIAMGLSTFGSGNFSLGIYQDSSGVPGALVGTLAGSSNPGGVIPNSVTYYDYSGSVGLAPLTTYWVEASSGSYYLWLKTTDLSQTGSDTLGASAVNIGGGGWTTDAASHLQLSITAVPEPVATSESMALAVLAGAFAWRVKRRSA